MENGIENVSSLSENTSFLIVEEKIQEVIEYVRESSGTSTSFTTSSSSEISLRTTIEIKEVMLREGIRRLLIANPYYIKSGTDVKYIFEMYRKQLKENLEKLGCTVFGL